MPLLLVHVAATWALVGLIWVVQLVQYPLFAHVGRAEFPEFHDQHCRRITWIVAPMMGLELVSGLALAAAPPAGVAPVLPWLGAALLAVPWACTALVSVPLHGRLGARRDVGAQARLVATNWIRTAAWSARGLLVLEMLRQALER